jgi:hypothetical protein
VAEYRATSCNLAILMLRFGEVEPSISVLEHAKTLEISKVQKCGGLSSFVSLFAVIKS